MLKIGSYNTLTVVKEVDFGIYLDAYEETILLPKKQVPKDTTIGDSLQVFVYTDSEDRPIATTINPLAVVGDIVALRVVDTNKYGAFLDWGLSKDLFLPFKQQLSTPEVGDTVVVYVMLDDISDRVIATMRLDQYLSKDITYLTVGEEVEIIVYRYTNLGASVIVNKQFSGLIFYNCIHGLLPVGTSRTAFVKQVRDDGKLDIILNKEGYKETLNNKFNIVDALQNAGGFLPYNSKSSAEEINRAFNMSRKAFKKIIGNLYKEKKIEFVDDGMRLI